MKKLHIKNYNKLKKKLATAYKKIYDILKYHFYKITQRLVEKYILIFLEILNIKGCLKINFFTCNKRNMAYLPKYIEQDVIKRG